MEFFLQEIKHLPGAFVYSLLGVAILVLSFNIWDWMTPYNLWKELVEKNNIALAIVVGAMAIGISIIISSAIRG
ncbi:MAG: DUF350 domain-containing protein [Candidatus Methylacidiphilales bacterium]|nr:DUF350 domain-containing protein [Candidatus Methylacidiphilales bacterium]